MLGNWGDIANDAQALTNLSEYREMFLSLGLMRGVRGSEGRCSSRPRQAGRSPA